MIEPSDGSRWEKDSDLDFGVASFAKEIYQKSDVTDSRELNQNDVDEICPLYASMRRITERYQSPELIGQGGMKEVYRVYDAKLARHVALAKPLSKYSLDHFDAFLREAHVTARLEHPSIINLFNMGIDENERPFFTMEFKRGNSLREHLSQIKNDGGIKKHPARKRLSIFLRVCEAIAYAHSRQVLHLDIKPSNIQIGEFGEVQVCDWGVGVVVKPEDQTDDSTALLDPDLYGPLLTGAKGTPAYMAPEQRDKHQQKTPQMDIYALGCVLFEMMTLESYRAEKSLSKVNSALAAIIRTAVSPDPDQRYESVDDMYRDLSRYMSHFSTSVEKPNLFREAKLFGERHREACLVVFSGGLLMLSLLWIFISQLSNKEKAAVLAREEAEAATELYREQVNKAIRLLHDLDFAQTKIESFRSQDHAMLTGEDFSKNVHQSIASFTELTKKGASIESVSWEYRFWWHFLAQDFDNANEIVKNGSPISPDLVAASARFAPLLNSEGYVETDDFIKLLHQMPNRHSLCARMLIFDQENHPRPIDERTQIIRHWVDINNGKTGEVELRYEEKSRKVELRGPVVSLGNQYFLGKTHKINISFLQTLDPLSLDIRETNISNLNQLKGLQIIELDLRDTPVFSLAPLSNYRSLQKIIVDEQQFSSRELRKVPPWMKVILSSDQDATN